VQNHICDARAQKHVAYRFLDIVNIKQVCELILPDIQ